VVEDWEKVEPDWESMPTDAELIMARETLKKLARAIMYVQFAEQRHGEKQDLWGGLVEARRQLTVTMHYLAYRHLRYLDLWEKMLEMDSD